MNRSTLVSLYRSLTRHKLHAGLNIGGLAVGIAVFLVLGLYVRFETSFEKWLPRHDGIYVVQTIWNLEGSSSNGAFPYTMGGLLDQMREDFPGVVGTRIRGGEAGGSVITNGYAVAEDVAQVDPSFFQVFDLPIAQGDGGKALRDPASALVSESFARRYFGTADAVGRTITVAMEAPSSYRIGGVFRDLPANSDFRLSVLIPMPRTPPRENWFSWGSTSLQTFLRFDSEADAKTFAEKLPAFVNRRAYADLGKDAWEKQRLGLLPISRLHLEPEGSASASRKVTVVTLALVGLLTLLIAIVNYTNLATARAGLRAREVAMRKVLGADRGALIRQFLSEAMLTVAVAALAGLILAELALPVVNAAAGLSLAIPYAVVVPALLLLVLLVGAAAGFYPALLLSRFPAASVLASARAPGGGRAGTRIREALVVFQFGLAIALMIGTVVLLAQTRHVRQTDLGFQREGLIVVRSMSDRSLQPVQRRAVAEAIRKLPGVEQVALSSDAVGGGDVNSESVPLPGVAGPGPSLGWVVTGPNFFELHGARLAAGRFFDDSRRADDAQDRPEREGRNIIINRRALAALGFSSADEAVGKTVGGARPRTIIGVVEDLRFGSPRSPNTPTYYLHYRRAEEGDNISASVRHTGDPQAALAAIRDVWQNLVPQVPFDGATADQNLADFYRADDRATRLFGMGSGLAVLIGCVGLWGLASFNTARRVKEVGIRKTLGASTADIVRLLVGQFLRPVLLANLVAWPLAFVAMRTWLAGFEDPIALSPLYFVGASLLTTVIAILTVLGQSLRASRAAPAWALRHD